MSQGEEEGWLRGGEKMKYSTSFGVYPAILGVGAWVCVAEEGYSPLRAHHSPLTLFHASFLPICSTFPHSFPPLLNSVSHSIPSFLLKPVPTLSPLFPLPEQDLQALVGAARVRGARPRERGRGQGAAAVRPEGNRP